MGELRYLDFEYSEDAEGNGLFDAMASVWAAQLPAVRAEVAAVLGWARAQFGATHGPLDEGGDWDYDLTEVPEYPASLSANSRDVEPDETERVRHTSTLSISGTPAFCGAFQEAFGLDA